MEIYMDELIQQSPYEIGVDFKYIETLARGGFGTVIHVTEISTNKDMAIKVINKSISHSSIIKRVKDEIAILKKLDHENIVKFYGFFESNNQLFIKMEYIKYGTLKRWMKNHKKITEEEASIILRQIFSAICYLHGMKICHRDIKPENIMLSRENDLKSIKIIDFGLSAENFDKLMIGDYCGTYIYMAPEQIEKKLYFISVDIWSIGILMFMLLNNGKHPFYIKGESRQTFQKKIKNCKINFYNKLSPMAKHLIFKLLEPNPSWRYNAVQACKHPWITRNKNDEVPLTFNEILNKSNMKKVGINLFSIVLFLNFLTKNKKYFINEKYINICNFYDTKAKKKISKQKETCLEVLSTNEEDESDSDLETEKNLFLKKFEKDNFIISKPQCSYIALNNQTIIKNTNNNVTAKKIYIAKSTKVLGNLSKILINSEKRPSFDFKKIQNKLNLIPIKKLKLEKINKNNRENILQNHLANISVNLLDDKKRKNIKKRNPKITLNKKYKIFNRSMSTRAKDESKKYIFNINYEEKNSNRQFPEIINTPIKRDTSTKRVSINYSKNCIILPKIFQSVQVEKKGKKLKNILKI